MKAKIVPGAPGYIGCTIKELPEEKHLESAKTAVDLNPANKPLVLAKSHPALTPAFLAGMTSKLWPSSGIVLGVYFMDTSDPSLKARILSHANAWTAFANVKFVEASASMAQVRLARVPGQGYYSYLGVDILQVPKNEQTLNLDSFSLNTPESEYNRVVKHEFGHTLGLVHEHLRKVIIDQLDVAKTIADFEATQGWSQAEVIAQVLTPVPETQLTANAPDVHSIMCYFISSRDTKSGQPIPGGTDIDDFDKQEIGKIYPLAIVPPPPPPPPPPVSGLVIHVINGVPTIDGYQVTKLP